MSMKKLVLSMTATALCGVALSINATPLTIVNNTDNDSTSLIHNILNSCSSVLLKEAGITRARHTNTVSEGNIKTACYFSPNNCVADVYMSDNCSGPIVATMEFSTTQGVKSVVAKSDKYKISASGFNVVIDQVA